MLWLVFFASQMSLMDMYKIMAACLYDSRLMEHRSTYWWHQTAQLTADGDAPIVVFFFFFYIYFYLHAQMNRLEQTMMLSIEAFSAERGPNFVLRVQGILVSTRSVEHCLWYRLDWWTPYAFYFCYSRTISKHVHQIPQKCMYSGFH